MATLQELKTQIENVNNLGITNLAEKNVKIPDNATTYEIMRNILKIERGKDFSIIRDSDFINQVEVYTIDRDVGIGENYFQEFSKLRKISGPSVSRVEFGAFRDLTSLVEVDLQYVNYIGDCAFSGCTGIESLNFTYGPTIGVESFNRCTNLHSVEFKGAPTIKSSAFSNSSKLKQVIIRAQIKTVPAIGGFAFDSTPIDPDYTGDDKGYIYVTSKAYDSFLSGWSEYSNNIRILEDYTVDGSTSGDLDPDKI